uniref:Uncharacterized protein n=1 Tax=Timema genevievae TaxID=629358 RepID=A0A7R9PPA8_TIMGE|nr:unnamed protein product [Timema genevievae]
MGNHLGRTTLSTRDQDSNPVLPIIGSPVYCEGGALEQLDTEAVELVGSLGVASRRPFSYAEFHNNWLIQYRLSVGQCGEMVRQSETELVQNDGEMSSAKVSAAILGVLLMMMNLNHPDKQYTSAVLNHCTLSCVMGSMVSDVIKMSFGLDAAVPLTASSTLHFQNINILQGIINVTLGSAFNINKTAHQTKANVWNNVVLSLNIITTATNVVISAFDMRQTSQGGMSILTTARTPTTTPAPSLLA